MKIEKVMKYDAMFAIWKSEVGEAIGPKYLHDVKHSEGEYGCTWTESGTLFFSFFSSRPVQR